MKDKTEQVLLLFGSLQLCLSDDNKLSRCTLSSCS